MIPYYTQWSFDHNAFDTSKFWGWMYKRLKDTGISYEDFAKIQMRDLNLICWKGVAGTWREKEYPLPEDPVELALHELRDAELVSLQREWLDHRRQA